MKVSREKWSCLEVKGIAEGPGEHIFNSHMTGEVDVLALGFRALEFWLWDRNKSILETAGRRTKATKASSVRYLDKGFESTTEPNPSKAHTQSCSKTDDSPKYERIALDLQSE